MYDLDSSAVDRTMSATNSWHLSEGTRALTRTSMMRIKKEGMRTNDGMKTSNGLSSCSFNGSITADSLKQRYIPGRGPGRVRRVVYYKKRQRRSLAMV